MKRIDAHHHFWQYEPEQYPWIDDHKACLKRDFLPEHLKALCQTHRLDAVISVQARQTVEETRWLLQFAEANPWIAGVVGWVPLKSDRLAGVLEPLAQSRSLKAVRHVVQDEPDDRFVLHPDFVRGVQSLAQHDLAYDLLVYPQQLAASIELVDQCPGQRFVLDHIGKPHISRSALDEAWRRDFVELAKRPNVWCKFSGVVTEVRDADWSVETLQPYWDLACELFGPDRLMYGSDWPVCTLRASYAEWFGAVEQLAAKLSFAEQQSFWSGAACAAYKLEL